VQFVNCFCSLTAYYARCTFSPGLPWQKAAFNKRKALFTSILDLALRKELVNCYIRSVALYGAETLTLRRVDKKYLENLEIWCWGRISWIDRVRKEEVLNRAKEEWNILIR